MSTEAGTKGRGHRQVPMPVVLAISSAMVCIGLIAWWTTRGSSNKVPSENIVVPVQINQQTPERAAESFLDAWRKRDFDTAVRISRGAARLSVQQKKAIDMGLPKEYEAVRNAWENLASFRLHFVPHQSDELSNDRLALRGVAEGEFLDKPYRRLMAFVLVHENQRWYVEQMTPGQILTPLSNPDLEDRAPQSADLPMRDPDGKAHP